MKYLLSLVALVIAGCSTSPTNQTPAQSDTTTSSQRLVYHIVPGTFKGPWVVWGEYTNDSTTCTIVITEADSILLGTVTNDVTHEVLKVSGFPTEMVVQTPHPPPMNLFAITIASSDTSVAYFRYPTFGFWPSGDSIFYDGGQVYPANNRSNILTIFGIRQ